VNPDVLNDRVAYLFGIAVIAKEELEVKVRAMQREIDELRSREDRVLAADEAAAYTRVDGRADESRTSTGA